MTRRHWTVVGLVGLLIAAAQGATIFDEQFDGTAADPNSSRWFPNDTVQGDDFDASVVDGMLRMAWTAGGGGGDGSGYFYGGPLAKVPLDMDGVQNQVWTWKSMNISAQVEFTDWNNIQTDVLFTPFEPESEFHEQNQNQKPYNSHYFGLRVFHLDGRVVFMEQSNPHQYLYLDGLGDGRSETDWRLTITPDGGITIEADQGGGWTELTHDSGPLQLTNPNFEGAEQFYLMFRHRSQMDWDPHYPPEGSMAEIDFIHGQLGTGEPPTCDPGDADGDGDVDDDDLSLLLSNWGTTTDCAHGEFSGVPPVNDDDLSLLLSNWTGAAAVPEPATLTLLALVAACPAVLRRRR